MQDTGAKDNVHRGAQIIRKLKAQQCYSNINWLTQQMLSIFGTEQHRIVESNLNWWCLLSDSLNMF